jgi:uncharacterized protein YodC (DUF2158 family)
VTLSNFHVGDVVILKSGGPLMTVLRVITDDDYLYCAWFLETGKREAETFPSASVKYAEGE